ncbi:MAG TPA: lysylphosphatidylglycerol synthase transmembrane domain-containing protein [Pseudoneobacillus sp.]|nr:lysylphosphatidylglycerol synthase transmembrane domain-containing protein [Pseudoneobacillus sp.]
MKFKKSVFRSISALLIVFFFILTLYYFDWTEFRVQTFNFFVNHPYLLGMITLTYFTSFLLRALAWKKYLQNQVRLKYCLQGVLLSLFINHITPIKVGDLARIWVLTKNEDKMSWDEATHSVVMMRLLDMLTLILFSLVGLILFSKEIVIKLSFWMILLFILIVVLFLIVIQKFLPAFYEKHWFLLKKGLFSSNSLTILPLILLSWILEGIVIWGVLKSFNLAFPFWKSIWVNSITVGGQVFQITPGGITTYESIMSVTLGTLGVQMKDAYHAAFISHAYKFLFSYVIGLFTLLLMPKLKMKELKDILASKRGE